MISRSGWPAIGSGKVDLSTLYKLPVLFWVLFDFCVPNSVIVLEDKGRVNALNKKIGEYNFKKEMFCN